MGAVSRGLARQVRCGAVRVGKVSYGRLGEAALVVVWQGWTGKAGKARLVVVWRVVVRQVWQVGVWHGAVSHGVVRHGR